MQLSIRILLLAVLCSVLAVGCSPPETTQAGPGGVINEHKDKPGLAKPIPPPDMPPLPAK